MNKLRFFLSLLLFTTFISGTFAQLSFPNGSTLNLLSNKSDLYPETEILFHTGKFKVKDYSFEKISDSLDERWSVAACVNGECFFGLPLQGVIKQDFGYNDTTGYFRFHVFTLGFEGQSQIKYNIINTMNLGEYEILTFNITYSKSSGLDTVSSRTKIKPFPNPAIDYIVINNDNKFINKVLVFDNYGRQILNFESDFPDEQIKVSIEKLIPGIYIIKTENSDFSTAFHRFIKK